MRPFKLDFFDHPFDCLICGEHIVYTSMRTVITDSRRKCPSCQGELLINEGTATAVRAVSTKTAGYDTNHDTKPASAGTRPV